MYRAIMSDEFMSRRRLVLLAILFEGGLAILALGLGWLLNEPPLGSLRWGWSDFLWGSAATLPMLLVLFVCIRWPIGPLARVRALLDIVRPLFHECSAVELAVVCSLAGIGEEMLFRGVLQGALGNWLGVFGGLILVNLLFGLLHCVTLTYAISAALAGTYLGCLMLWQENLLVVMVPHALFDFIALLWIVHTPPPIPTALPQTPSS